MKNELDYQKNLQQRLFSVSDKMIDLTLLYLNQHEQMELRRSKTNIGQ